MRGEGASAAGGGFDRVEIDRRLIGRDLRVFERHFPGTTTLTILLEGPPGSMQSPEAIAVMTGLQRAMAEDPEVGRTSSVADLVRRTYEVFAPEEAGNGLPLERELIAQLFMLADSPAFDSPSARPGPRPRPVSPTTADPPRWPSAWWTTPDQSTAAGEPSGSTMGSARSSA